MANDYSGYSYARTLRFFEAYYPYDTEDVHYADLLLSMNQCKTIDEILAIRERVKEKISEISQSALENVPNDICKELSECVSKVLTWNKICFDRFKDNLKLDVNSCYDDNILRLLREREILTASFCGECFLNLTFCSTYSKQKEVIICIAKDNANLDVSELLEKIAKHYEDFRKHWDKYKSFKEGMNGYVSAKQVVQNDFDYLKQFNWRLLPWQKSVYREIDKEEMKKREEQKKNNILKLEEENRKKQEEERERKKEDKEKEIYSMVFAIIVIIAIVVGLGIAMDSFEAGFWTFIIICAIIKFYAGFFK